MSTIDPVLVPKPPNHIAFVDYWFAQLPADAFASGGMPIFDLALNAIWQRSYSILGAVTLKAFLDRVFYSVGEIYPWLLPAAVGSQGIDLSAMSAAVLPQDELKAGLRRCLIDILVILGKLTSEILSSHIYAGLLGVLMDVQGGATSLPESPSKIEKFSGKKD